MSHIKNLEDIERLYAARGGLHYGEGVTQMEHALQCAALAEEEGCPPSLVIAALLHDVGHLFEKDETLAEAGVDDRHEAAGAGALAGIFAEAVWRPIALHVAAKRYLCSVEPRYLAALSQASQRSLVLQGGPFHQAQALAFQRAPFWQEAVRLRRFDDMGKRDENSTRDFSSYLPMMQGLLSSPG
ncbi:MAG TPA: HD domain-containing protein [Rhizomicrobium sp.]|jgi:phosphonate degradation associated HDIG domain protein|nr:HD domain-containing protein [Rhizomicrobium sp.]